MNIAHYAKITMTVVIGLIIIGCGSVTNTSPITEDPDTDLIQINKLVYYQSCDELVDSLQQESIQKMEESLDSYIRCYDDYGEGDEDIFISADSPSTGSEGSGNSFTGTNTQEANVDEADIIKTDGTYIYVATDEGIDIFKAWPLDQFQKIQTYALEHRPSKLYLSDGKLIALTTYYDSEGLGTPTSNLYYAAYGSSTTAKTEVTVLDVQDPQNPVVEQVKWIEGSLLSSRMIDGVVHVLSSQYYGYSTEYPTIDWELRADYCTDPVAKLQIDQIIADSKLSQKEIILATTEADYLPTHGDQNSEQTIGCESLVADSSSDTNLIGLLSLEIDSQKEQISFIKGRSHVVYASTKSIYLATQEWTEDETHVHKFALNVSSGLHAYFGSGGVAGHIQNSFSMSEYEGAFRIATTLGRVSRDGVTEVSNNIFVLDANNVDLPVLGSIVNIAEGEQIYAARFFGKKGYMVTYKKVDPFFVFDLSDPTNPILEGELKMPGYSTYLHLLDDNHIIGLGKDAEEAEEGDFAWFQGLKLAIFDVTDGNNPTLTDDEVIGSRGTDSKALYDHHAFTFDAQTGILALPLSLHDGSEGGNDYGIFQYNGVHLYSLDDQSGIETIAEIALPDGSTNPERTLMMSDDTASGLYVLDRGNLYLIDMNGSYQIIGQEAVSNEVYTCFDICYGDI